MIGLCSLVVFCTQAAEEDCPGNFIIRLIIFTTPVSCLVCVKVLDDIVAKVPADKKSDQNVIDKTIRAHCKGLKGKEDKFCNYIGALPESATSIMNEVTKPLSWSMPTPKVCEKLKTKGKREIHGTAV